MNLLIVDDDILVIEGILAGVDWSQLDFDQILTANCYSEAVNLLNKQKIHMMLCDIEMPYGNGIHLVQWVKEQKMETECIFLTCHDEFDFAKQAVTLRCFDYLLKPVLPERLAAVLKAAAEHISERQKEQYYFQYGRKYVESLGDNMKNETDDTSGAGLVQKAEAYIMAHISEDITVEQIAESMYISTNHLTRLFKKGTGKTPIDYITEQRLFLAKELLEQNQLSVSMISARVGYGNYSYFTRIFKRAYGKPPREYREWYLRSKGRQG